MIFKGCNKQLIWFIYDFLNSISEMTRRTQEIINFSEQNKNYFKVLINVFYMLAKSKLRDK